MMNDMNSYFVAEKQESVIFVVVGLLAIGLSLWLWMNGHRLKSMALPLVVIALMQIVVGSTIYLRTDSQLSTLNAQLQTNPAALKAEETARMKTVIKNFSIYKAIELLLLIIGVGMIAFFQRHNVVTGIGVGLVLQSSFTLALDVFAAARGADYLSAIQGLGSSANTERSLMPIADNEPTWFDDWSRCTPDLRPCKSPKG